MTPADLTLADAVVWAAAISTILSFGTTIWTILKSGSKENVRRLVALEARAARNDIEVQRLHDAVDQLPNAEMMHRLELSLARMEGHIDKLDERLKPVTAIAERMQDLLMEQGRK